MSFKTKWIALKAWLKKNLPNWLSQGMSQAFQWLLPFLVKYGMTFLVSEKTVTEYKAKAARESVKIPSKIEHEDD